MRTSLPIVSPELPTFYKRKENATVKHGAYCRLFDFFG